MGQRVGRVDASVCGWFESLAWCEGTVLDVLRGSLVEGGGARGGPLPRRHVRTSGARNRVRVGACSRRFRFCKGLVGFLSSALTGRYDQTE